ncbi:hypothetical protein [Streptomyces tubercidicus]|nr:hypothetical protein [Streptomyces tubercidicus]WAU15717.1 hypothetical protein STRTU_006459 [Streptomyces tubercidicus]
MEPSAEWVELRSKCPVASVSVPGGSEAKLLTRYDDVKELLADPRFTRPRTDHGSAESAFSVPMFGECTYPYTPNTPAGTKETPT